MKLGIFTHVTHKLEREKTYAYSPYVREINLYLKNVEKAEVVSPITIETHGDFSAMESYRYSNLTFTKIPSFDLLNFKGALKASLRIPSIMVVIISAMRRADHLHIRSPGNIGLMACVCQIFFPHKPKTAKYAGNWDPEAKQPWTYKLQKWILSNTFLTRNMTVMVYGNWPDQSKNILPFFTASFTESEIEKLDKDFSPPYKFLFVGNQVPGKQPIFALNLIEALKEKHINAELHVYGDGPLRVNVENESENKDYIHLHGNQPLEVLKQAYKDSHFVILASKSEGWPKAVAEAMFFGCIPIATGVSCVPWMLGGGSRGILVPPAPEGRAKEKWFEKIVIDVQDLINNPEEMRKMSLEAQQWSQEYTIEKFEAEIKKLLVPNKR